MQNDVGTRSFAAYRIRRQVTIIEPVVRIKAGGSVIVIAASMILVSASLRDELDLEGALAGAFRTGIRSRYGHFTDGVGAGPNVGEKAVIGFQQIVLNVDAVDGDIESAFRQTIDG